MSVTLFFGIRISGRPYETIAHKLDEDSYSTYKVENLKKVLASELLKNFADASGLELIYCGSVLEDTTELSKEGIKSGSTIHVFDKNEKQEIEQTILTEDTVAAASAAYRSVCFRCPGYNFPKVIRPEVLHKVLEKYPEFYNDLGAFAILKDPVLLEKMVRSKQAKEMGDQYPILITSAKFVAETMINNLKTNPTTPQTTTAEDSSDSSENDSPQASPNHADNQRISRNQLAAALLFAGRASLNSLSNIAERTIDDAEMATTSNTTASEQVPSQSTGDAGSLLVNRQRYTAELETMREMGLTDENNNLQALILCNGNVEAAVTLVLGIGNFA